jgi:FAD/FMN-containing dehydrogenase
MGGLTGLVNGAVPTGLDPVLILSMGRMNRIDPVDTVNNTVLVEAGAVLANVKSAAEQAGRYFPLSHGGEGSSQIGGNLSTNSGGNNALRYGTARDQVLGLEVVLPDGSIWNGLRGLRKNTAGYDLNHLFIGAEGTLGIITRAVLKVRPLRCVRETAIVAVENPRDALSMLRLMERHAGELICACELMSAAALWAAMTIEGTRYAQVKAERLGSQPDRDALSDEVAV